jgi:hypothetical protein
MPYNTLKPWLREKARRVPTNPPEGSPWVGRFVTEVEVTRRVYDVRPEIIEKLTHRMRELGLQLEAVPEDTIECVSEMEVHQYFCEWYSLFKVRLNISNSKLGNKGVANNECQVSNGYAVILPTGKDIFGDLSHLGEFFIRRLTSC